MSARVELIHKIVKLLIINFIINLFHAGHKASDIIRDTDYAPRTVYCVELS